MEMMIHTAGLIEPLVLNSQSMMLS